MKINSLNILELIKKGKKYLQDVKSELGKIVWPTRDKTTKTTYVVLVFIVLVTIFLGAVDIGFSKIISYII